MILAYTSPCPRQLVRSRGYLRPLSAYVLPDRLPTVSASQALKNAATREQAISSNLPTLDSTLKPGDQTTATSNNSRERSGLPKGQVTEVCGPPGVGKTALCMQVAANTLCAGHKVVWIDTGAPLPGPRLRDIVESNNDSASGGKAHTTTQCKQPPDKLLENLAHLNVNTLPHLLALFLHPPAGKFPPDGASLIVIDNLSTLLATAFPRKLSVNNTINNSAAIRTDSRPNHLQANSTRKARLQWSANRKWTVISDLAAAMAKLAAVRDVAILIVNQFATSLKGVTRAVLKPAITGSGWEDSVHNQLLLWRDFAPVSFTSVGVKHGSADLPISASKVKRLRYVMLGRRSRKERGGPLHGFGSSSTDAVPFIIVKVSLSMSHPGFLACFVSEQILKKEVQLGRSTRSESFPTEQ